MTVQYWIPIMAATSSLLLVNRTPMCANKLIILVLLLSHIPCVLNQGSFEEAVDSLYEESHEEYYSPDYDSNSSQESPWIPDRDWINDLADLSIWDSSWWTQFSFWEPPSSSPSSVSSPQYSQYDSTGICEPNPCDNWGTCISEGTAGGTAGDWYCLCSLGFTGDFCQYDDPCEPNPCYNGGGCESDVSDTLSYFYCTCEPGWSGRKCQTEILSYDPCDCSPCLHGGTCLSDAASPDQYVCYCPADFSGTHCETELSDPCSPDPCDYGICYYDSSRKGGFWCECFEGFNGTHCTHDYLKPEIYCEAGFSYQIDIYDDSREVYWDLPGTYDNSEEYTNGDVTVWCNPPSGTSFSEGTRTVLCKVIDESGNDANCTFDVLITKDEVPEINCIGDLTRSAATGERFAVVSYPEPNVFNANSFSCWPASGSNFNIGDTVVTCQAWKNSVSARCQFNVYVRDLEKPTIICPDYFRIATAYQASYNQVWWGQPDATDNSGMVRQWCDPDPGSILYIGDHIIVCYAEDNHGNQESCSFGVEVLDNEPPSISCPGRKVRSMDWDQDNAQIWFLGEVQAWDNSEYQPIIECNPREGYFSMGETEVECTATDQAGNERGCKFGVNVYDSQQPTIVCPSDIYAKRDPDEAGTNVDWAVQGWDNADDSPDVNCRPDQQHVFLFGTTTVSCVAADESNNRGFCQFNVEVTDHDVATITCPDDIEIETIAGDNYNVAKWTTPVYTVDNNIQGTVFCNYDSGSQFNIGSQMVECTVTLENGISSGCSFFVRVIDNEDPTIQCPANQIILSENGDPVTVNTDGPTYDDNSGAVTMYCSPHLSTTAFDIGLWEITCEAVDRSGNKAECTFGINIVAAASSDPCEGDTNQCNGRGVCLTTSTASKQYTCSCFEGWTGQFCQDTDYQDPCEGPGADGDYNWQCNQKGTCITTDITLGEYTCECYDGWIGDRCEESENENSESTTAVAGDGNGGDGNGDIDRENSAQSGLNTAIVAGGASGGLLIVIIILVAIIACFVVKGRRSKPSERTLSTHPLAASNGSQPENGKSPSVKKDGLENPSYSSHIDSRYSHALPTISQPTAPPNMLPPAYTPMAATTGKKIPPRLPSTNPSALYQGGSVMYSRGGSVATYGGYERPDINGGNQPNQSYDNTLYETNVYEELDEVTLNPPQYEEPEYMDVEG